MFILKNNISNFNHIQTTREKKEKKTNTLCPTSTLNLNYPLIISYFKAKFDIPLSNDIIKMSQATLTSDLDFFFKLAPHNLIPFFI
jgi:hypothetical protein